MATPKYLIASSTFLIFFTLILRFASAQNLDCEQLKLIVSVASSDSTFKSLRGIEKENKFGKAKEYEGTAVVWKPDGYIIQGQYIKYIDYEQRFAYHCFFDAGATGKLADEQRERIVKMIQDCLGAGWLLVTSTEKILGDPTTTYYLKNLGNNVVLKIRNLNGTTHIDCYNDSRERLPACTLGNCDDYFGSRRYFSENTYSGTFIDETLSGMGQLYWYSQKTSYQGSFIGNQIAGYGNMFNENNQVIETGLFFKGTPVKVDMSNNSCQFGDCQMGFGLKVINNAVYIGNFDNSLPDGLGETIFTTGVHYGYYKAGHENGKGIFINSKGNYTFGNFVDAITVGKYEVDFADKTTLQANTIDHTASYFDDSNILTKSGSGTDNAFVEKADIAYLVARAAATSIKEFYSYRQSGYKEIRGEQNNYFKALAMEGGYKSTLLFQKLYNASIDVDHNRYYFVTVYLSGNSADKLKWVSIYNKFYDILNKILGSRWKVIADDGKAGPQKHSSKYVFQNMFDKTKTVNLSIDQRGVELEIH